MAENELTAVSNIGGKPVKMSGVNVEVIPGGYCMPTPDNPIDYIYEEYQDPYPAHIVGNNGLMGLGIGYTDDQEGTHFWRGYVGNTGCNGKLVYAKYDLETSAFDENTTETIVTDRQFDHEDNWNGTYITGYNGTPIKSEAFAFRDEEYGYIVRESELGRTVLVVEHSYGYPTNEPEHFILNNVAEGGIYHYAAVFEDLDFDNLNYRDFYIDTSDPSNRVVMGDETYWKVQMNDHSIGGGTTLSNGTDLKIDEYDTISVNTDGIVDNPDEMSFVAGSGTYASGYGAAAFGISASAIGIGAFAEGWKTSAFANYAHTEGHHTSANEEAAHAEGYATKARGVYTHAEGYGTSAANYAAHAEGYNTLAAGLHSHAEGESTKANGLNSHAEGLSSYAATISHAEGQETRALGKYSHAEGYKTVVIDEFVATNSDGGHAEGWETSAFGKGTHVEGYYTIASGDNMHVGGRYNKTLTDVAFVIGNGNSTTRSDAMVIDWDGNVSAAGKVFTSGIELAGGNASLNKVYFDNDGVSAYDNGNSEYVTISWYDLITAVGGTHHPV